MNEIRLTPEALDDLRYWANQDPKTIRRIYGLFEELIRTPFTGTGKPEPLKYDKSGYWSRRINGTDRIIYKVLTEGDVLVTSCRYHYNDK